MSYLKMINSNPRTMLITIMFFYYASMGILIPYLPLLLSRTVDAKQVGVLIAIGAFTMMVMQPIWGWLSDKYSIRTVLLIAISGTITTTIFFPFANGFTVWVLLLSVYFIFQSPIATLIDTLAVTNFTDTFGRIRLWGSIGFGIAVFLGGILLGVPIYMIHFVLLFVTLAFVFYYKSPIKQKITSENKIGVGQLFKVFRTGPIFFVLFLLLFTAISMKGNATFYSIGLDELHVYGLLLGSAWLLQVFPEIGVFLLVDKLAKKITSWTLVIIGVSVFAIHFSLLGHFQNIWAWVLLQPLVSIAFCFWYSGAIRLIKSLVPIQFQATGQSIFSAVCNGLGGMSGSILSGIIVSTWNVFIFYQFAGILCFGTALLVIILKWFVEKNKATDVSIPMNNDTLANEK
ncbi:MAG: MFS transporter [Bacillaceae bacterium]|nr:MFS transporter [Bacillaceae bacterium]